MKSIEIKTLLRYSNNEMTREEKKEIEVFLKANPHYIKVLRGLANLQKRLGPDGNVEEFLEQKKREIKPGLIQNQ